MYFDGLRERLRAEIGQTDMHRLFASVRRRHPVFKNYRSIDAVLFALENRAAVGYRAQDELLRALVLLTQRRPAQRIWQLLLSYAFFPALLLVRASTVSREESGDLDGFLWSSFFEILHTYPVKRRSGSVAQGLLMDTKKHYFRTLAQAHDAEEQRRRLVRDTYRFRDPHVGVYLVMGMFPRTPNALAYAHAVVRAAPLTPLDQDLLALTDIEGYSMKEYMDVRHLTTGDENRDRRERNRLWRRRLRARMQLQEFLKTRFIYCPVL